MIEISDSVDNTCSTGYQTKSQTNTW